MQSLNMMAASPPMGRGSNMNQPSGGGQLGANWSPSTQNVNRMNSGGAWMWVLMLAALPLIAAVAVLVLLRCWAYRRVVGRRRAGLSSQSFQELGGRVLFPNTGLRPEAQHSPLPLHVLQTFPTFVFKAGTPHKASTPHSTKVTEGGTFLGWPKTPRLGITNTPRGAITTTPRGGVTNSSNSSSTGQANPGTGEVALVTQRSIPAEGRDRSVEGGKENVPGKEDVPEKKMLDYDVERAEGSVLIPSNSVPYHERGAGERSSCLSEHSSPAEQGANGGSDADVQRQSEREADGNATTSSAPVNSSSAVGSAVTNSVYSALSIIIPGKNRMVDGSGTPDVAVVHPQNDASLENETVANPLHTAGSTSSTVSSEAELQAATGVAPTVGTSLINSAHNSVGTNTATGRELGPVDSSISNSDGTAGGAADGTAGGTADSTVVTISDATTTENTRSTGVQVDSSTAPVDTPPASAADGPQGLLMNHLQKLSIKMKPAWMWPSFGRGSTAGQGSADDQQTCMICLDDYLDGDTIMVLPCSHTFHKECVVAWLSSHDTCPACRSSLLHSANPPPPVL